MATQPLSLTSQVIAYNDTTDLRDKTASSTYQGATIAEVLALSPGGVDTTYDLASAQDGANVDITLTGSDATVDTVQLTAGTNITLTETAGRITIDAAGGGPKVYRAQFPAIPENGTAMASFIYENTVDGALAFFMEFEDYGLVGSYTTRPTTDLSPFLGQDVQKVMVRATDAATNGDGTGAGIAAAYSIFGGTGFIAIDGAAKNGSGTSFNLEILVYA